MRELAHDISLQAVPAHCLGVKHYSRRRQIILDVLEQPVGESSIMPSIYIEDKIAELRVRPTLSLFERYQRLKKAGEIYKSADLAGLSPQDYINLVTSVSGLPASVIENSLTTIAHALHHMNEILTAATPRGAVWEISAAEVETGCSLFSRRGDVVGIIAAGNGPGVHALWPQAIAMGYRTLVRPSLREPFTAQRLIAALELAGLADYVALIPTDHQGAETLIATSDFAIVYGGDAVAAQYRGNSRVLVQGPGRSKIIVGKDFCPQQALKVAAQSVIALGGAACVATSAILVEENPREFAEQLRFELNQQLSLTRFANQQEANSYQEILQSDSITWDYQYDSQRGYLLKPHVNVVESATDPKLQRELPFPCVTIAPFIPEPTTYQALAKSLVVTVLSRQTEIIERVLANPSIANVYIGNVPTHWMDFRVPHDGYLADFLMRNRGVKIF